MKLTIGDNLRRLRGRKNVTQERLAEYLGVSCQAVSRWETSTAYPDIELLPELARFFGVSLEELMGCESAEKEAEEKAMEIYNERYKDVKKALADLHELEKQFPNNWQIRAWICESLVFPKPDSYDEVLPELRRYAYEALEAFPQDREDYFRRIIRPMIIAAPEDEVETWADYLNDGNRSILGRNNLMSLRYAEREDWEKCRHYQSVLTLDALNQLTSHGLVPETVEPTLEASMLVFKLNESVRDAVVGVPYRDEAGEVHNSVMLFERIMSHCSIALWHFMEKDADTATQGFRYMEKAVDLTILYADALRNGYFVSDNPYIEPQEFGNHRPCWTDEAMYPREKSLDYCRNELHPQWLPAEIEADPRYTAQIERLDRKKQEMTEYWRTRTS